MTALFIIITGIICFISGMATGWVLWGKEDPFYGPGKR